MTCSLQIGICWSDEEEGIVLVWKLHYSQKTKVSGPLGWDYRVKARESTHLKVANRNECALFRAMEKQEWIFMSNLHKSNVIHNDSLPGPNKALCQDFEDATERINCSLPKCPASRKLEQQYIPVCVCSESGNSLIGSSASALSLAQTVTAGLQTFSRII